jgi:hypothetical protein
VFKKGGTDASWASWSAGDSLVTTMVSTPKVVTIVFNGTSGAQTVLTTADFSPGGMTNPGPTSTLQAAFSGSPSSGTPPLVVQFIDQSTGSPVGWNWDFGDTQTSAIKNPQHVYNSQGSYTVSLTVTNSTGSTDSTTHPITVSLYSPTVSGISPSQNIQGVSVPISVYGNNFVNGANITLKNQSSAIAATSVVFQSATLLTGSLVIPSGATVGPWDVVVTNPDTQTGTLTNGFMINPPGPAPTFISISPSSGSAAGGTSVTITGTNFISGGSFGVTIGGASATSVVRVDASHITAVTPAGTVGAQNVTITNSDGQTSGGTGAYTYQVTPTFTGIAPTAGQTSGGTGVTITGTGFTDATAVTFGGTAATSFTVNSATQITATTPAHAAAGVVDVVVSTPNGIVTGSNVYTYTYATAPTFTSIAPTSGPIAGGMSVTIVGTNFVSGGSFGVTIGGASATSVVRVDASHITAVTPAGTVGAQNVTITNNDGQSVTGTGSYTYVAAPTFGSISPATGNSIGGTPVTITGTNFVTGGTSVTIGGTAATGVSVSSGTTLTATTPSGTAGLADVVVTTAGGSATGTGAYDYYTIQSFTTVGTTNWPVPPGVTHVDYLVVAGGGGGGRYGAGGGAGGFLTGTLTGLSGSQTVTVGKGGPGGTGTTIHGTNGDNSVFGTTTVITATGGGGGGGSTNANGIHGGSGGGSATGTGTAGTGIFGQGFDGGLGVTYQSGRYNNGGGGGASTVGGTATSTVGGNGGAGSYSDISGTNTQYACGGGGGGRTYAGTAGCTSAGDGRIGNNAGYSATANFGGGGGGGGNTNNGGAGGSGIVIIRYY